MDAERVDIRRMTLRAARRGSVRCLMPEIEDAFRTASWPVTPGRHGVLLVRRLDLGRLAPGLSRQAISRRLGEAVQDLGVTLCRPGEPVPEDAEILHWPGRVEMLAAAMLTCRRTSMPPWWASIVAGRRDGGVEWTDLVARVGPLVRDLGPAALGALLLRLVDHGAGPEAAQIAREHAIATARHLPGAISVLGTGGAEIVEWTEPATTRSGRRRDGDAAVAAVTPIRESVLVSAVPFSDRRTVQSLLEQLPPKPHLHLATSLLVLAQLRGTSSLPEVLALASSRRVTSAANGPEKPKASGNPNAFDVQPAVGPSRVAKHIEMASPVQRRTLEAVQASPPKVANEVVAPQNGPEEMTRLGGLPVLVNLITMAGLPVLDETLKQALCLRLLRGFGHRLIDDDSCLEALPEPLIGAPSPVEATSVAVPAACLLEAVPGRYRLARVEGWPGRRALIGPRGAGLSAVVDARSLRQLRPALRGRIETADALLQAEDVLPMLLAGLGLALQWLCLRRTGRGWRVMLGRPAYISASDTHIDITVDLDDVRIEERRAGLDLSPGWVRWLGRVVSLHFERFDKPERLQ